MAAVKLDVVRAFDRYFPGDKIGKPKAVADDLIARGLCVARGAAKPAPVQTERAGAKPAAKNADSEAGAPPAQG